MKLSNVIVCFRPKRLTLKGYKQYWFKFQDTSISYFKSKEESIGEPIQQINLKGTEYIFIIMMYPPPIFYSAIKKCYVQISAR